MKDPTRQFLCIVLLLVSVPVGMGLAFEFPEIDGWTKPETPDHYTTQTLYDYIDGAADLYLRYDFRELDVMNYENAEGTFITIDLYTHGDELNAFGIYSQERLPSSARIALGVEGYTEQGILNFLRGRYYVKISGYGLSGDSLITAMASLIEDSIDGTSSLPHEFSYFPADGRLAGTEMYIANDYLGHSFLQSVYTVEYDRDGATATVFLIDAADSEGVQRIVGSFYSIAGMDEDVKNASSSVISINDPFHKSDGPVHLRWNGRYVWGIYSTDNALAEKLLSGVISEE